jgi:hypothetical protein
MLTFIIGKLIGWRLSPRIESVEVVRVFEIINDRLLIFVLLLLVRSAVGKDLMG